MTEPTAGPSVRGRKRFYRFLRYSHILSSMLREILEDEYLLDLDSYALNRMQFCFLKLIVLNSPIRVGEVARCAGVTPAAGSKTVARLEEAGFVERQQVPEDRRGVFISATSSGIEIVRGFERCKATRFGPVLHSLGSDRADVFNDALEEICLGLIEARASRRGPCLRCAGYYIPDCPMGRVQGQCALRVGKRNPSGVVILEA